MSCLANKMVEKSIYLFIAPFFPSKECWRGGFLYDMVSSMQKDGRYQIYVLVGETGEDYRVGDINVYRFGTCLLGCSNYFSFFTNWIKNRKLERKLKSLGIPFTKISVCHVHLLREYYCTYASWIKRKNKSVYTILHHHFTGEASLNPPKMIRWVPCWRMVHYLRVRAWYLKADLHVFCSKKSLQLFGCRLLFDELRTIIVPLSQQIRLGACLPPISYRDAIVLYNGYNSALFWPKELSSKGQSEYCIGCVGNFTKQKAQRILIAAFSEMRRKGCRARLKFLGSGMELESCKQLARILNIEEYIDFLPEVDHQQIAQFYQSLDLYVLPSYWEAFNCSLVEAWACGIPVISVREISFREVLCDDKVGEWTFPMNNVKELAIMLVKMYHNRPSRPKLLLDLDEDVLIEKFLDAVTEKRQLKGK